MPMKIRVAVPPEHGAIDAEVSAELQRLRWWKRRSWEVGEADLTITLPSIWGVLVLVEVAANLELRGELPAPHDPERGLGDCSVKLEVKIQDEGYRPRYESVLLQQDDLFCLPESADQILKRLRKRRSRIRSVSELVDEIDRLAVALREADLPDDLGDLRRLLVSTSTPAYAVEKYTLVALREAARFSLAVKLPLWLESYVEMKPVDRPLLFQSVALEGFTCFTEAKIIEDQSAVILGFQSGYRYRVPVADVLDWYPDDASGKLLNGEVVGSNGEYVRLDFERGVVFVSHNAVLENCEPMYQCFGGCDGENLEQAKARLRAVGSFRIEPDQR